MLTAEENERLTCVGPGTPMGELLRRFWTPFLLSSDLPEADGEPVRVRLLGESLLAFRATSGRVGLVERQCAHRLADLFFGRNEEDGLRCTYHGWKYDVDGHCVDMPTEASDSAFKSKIRLVSYPVLERAGVLWTYMGPKEHTPELPDLEFARVPESHRFVSWNYQENNFAQAIEGGIDTFHSVFLHSTLDSHRKLDAWQEEGKRRGDAQAQFRTNKNPPKLATADTDFGLIIGGRYPGDDALDYWRFNIFMMPFYTAPPGRPDDKSGHAFVPLDDHTTARWTFTWSDKPLPARVVAEMRKGSGVHPAFIPGTHHPLRNKSNDYHIDREEQRTLTFTGIKGVGEQDFSVQEGMGPVVERWREHLGTTDVGIIAMRRRLLKAATDLAEGVEPYAATHPDAYRIRPGDAMLPVGADWPSHEATKAALAAKW